MVQDQNKINCYIYIHTHTQLELGLLKKNNLGLIKVILGQKRKIEESKG